MFERLLFCFVVFFSVSEQCDIWKAGECPPGPSKDDEDLMRSQQYTEEQLTAYCDAGKSFSDCVNEHLLCCDMKSEYAAALASLDLQLRRNVGRLGKYCPDMNETNPIQYRCRTTIKTIRGTRMRRTTTPKPVCNVERAGTQCSPIIENRVRFNRRWSAQEKAQWCRDTHDYYQCAQTFLSNCSTTSIANEVTQLTVFLDYIEKSANRECPGGLAGCTIPLSNGTSCIDRVSFFLEQNARANEASSESNFSVFILSICLMRLFFSF